MAGRFSRRKPMAEINVVPYIDVTLVLLIIFMITAPLLQTGVEVDLPQAQAKVMEQEQIQPVIVTVDKSGNYYIEIGVDPRQPISAEELLIRVAAVLRNKPDTKIYIYGHDNVDYGKVVTAMAALQQAGAPSVGLLTRPLQN